MATKTVLAVDVGAESGRVIAVHFDGHKLVTEEIYRFANVPVTAPNALYWDILRIWNDIQTGIGKADVPASIGIDTWGVDFALLDKQGHLLANPVHYRDSRTDGMLEYVFSKVPRAEIFERTGNQTMAINSLFQLASLAKNQDSMLANAKTFLAIPDLLNYWLTGVKANEFSTATTTQCFDQRSRSWISDILDRLAIPSAMFGEVTSSGTILGKYHHIPVVLTAQHDTASAAVSVPACTPNFAYLSSGTWSLLGVELATPVINLEVLAANLTNEGGFKDQPILLKDIMGLWLLQECRRDWRSAGQEFSYAQLADLAAGADPFAALINPDDPLFLKYGNMVERVQQYCANTRQRTPQSVAEVVRCIFESLALAYSHTLRQLSALSGKSIEVLHIVGGGSQNAVLCQMTADAANCPVVAGPVEATAIGNAIVQLIALGELGSIDEGRQLVRNSFPLVTYQPGLTEPWAAAHERFRDFLAQGTGAGL